MYLVDGPPRRTPGGSEEAKMGKTNGRGPPPPREDRQLTQRPMAAAFKGMRVGPECLECKGPIDSRVGYSLQQPRGSRKHQRHGFLHPDCQEKAEKRICDAQSMPVFQTHFEENVKVVVRQPGVRLALPALDEEDIADALAGRGQEA